MDMDARASSVYELLNALAIMQTNILMGTIAQTVASQNTAARRINAQIPEKGDVFMAALEPLYSLQTGLVLPHMPATLDDISALSEEALIEMFTALKIEPVLLLAGEKGLSLWGMRQRLALQIGITADIVGMMKFERV